MTQSIKIYRINNDYYRFRECINNTQIIKKILSFLNEKRPLNDKIKFEGLSTFKEKELIYYLYVHKHKEKESKWEEYFPKPLIANWNFQLQNLAIVLFVDNGQDIFLVIGGNAFQQVVNFIDHSFGLKIYSKIIKPDLDEIQSINTRVLTGNRSGLSEQYSDKIIVADFAKFGKLPTEAHLTLSKNITNEYFSFLKNSATDRVKIQVGKSFKIKKQLTFEELKQVFIELGYIMQLAEQEYLSSFIQETDYKVITENFEPLLIEKILSDFTNKKNERNSFKQKFKFDLCKSGKLIQFYSADKYVLTEKCGKGQRQFAETHDKDEIYNLVLNQCIKIFPENNTPLFDFRGYIQSIRLLSYSDGKKQTSGSYLYHFTSEFNLAGQTIFLVDNKWYRLKYSFIQELKLETLALLKRRKLPRNILNLAYNKGERELDYNRKYKNKDRFLVLDTITPHHIELCDILYIGTEATFLIHVKKGFNNTVRELTNQIEVSSKRLNTDLKSKDKNYLNEVWRLYKKKYPNDIRYNKDDFFNSFENKIVYVFAFISQRQDDADIILDIDKYTSNIAKYSLIECNRSMQEFSYELNIHQIKKEHFP